jgi:acyl-CoA thioester hydrolase
VPAQWSSPVRYVECDQQGVVFNAHYLTWADEASNVWWASRGLPWVDLIAAGAEPVVKARTSATVRFTVRVKERVCCVVRNTYVWLADGRATPWPDEIRERISPDRGPSAR